MLKNLPVANVTMRMAAWTAMGMAACLSRFQSAVVT